MKNKIKLSIILPVYNEYENLEYLLPQLSNLCISLNLVFEIIVVDDQSTDSTEDLFKRSEIKILPIKHLVRKDKRSLPMSIFEGIEQSQFESVLWLDADGSMDIISVEKLLKEYINNSQNFYIGSRFVSGGGYKGQDENDNRISKIYKNIKNSEDSFLAIYLSIIFNKVLKYLIKVNISDLTSGFIIGQKKYISKKVFSKSNYGEYFLYLVADLIYKKRNIIEIGYICKPRKYGNSKTSNNLMTLIRLGLPYIKAAILCKKIYNQKK